MDACVITTVACIAILLRCDIVACAVMLLRALSQQEQEGKAETFFVFSKETGPCGITHHSKHKHKDQKKMH